MEITVNAIETPKSIKAKDLPKGTIGKLREDLGRPIYVVHTNENGPMWLIIWPTANPPAIEAVSELDAQKEVPEPQLTDWGTRYSHLQDHLESLEAAIEAFTPRAWGADGRARLTKLTNAAEVMRATIDSYSGIKDTTSEYALYRLLHGIPADPENIEGGRGTPLI